MDLSAGPFANIVSSPARFLSIKDFFVDQDNKEEIRFDISDEDPLIARSSTNFIVFGRSRAFGDKLCGFRIEIHNHSLYLRDKGRLTIFGKLDARPRIKYLYTALGVYDQVAVQNREHQRIGTYFRSTPSIACRCLEGTGGLVEEHQWP